MSTLGRAFTYAMLLLLAGSCDGASELDSFASQVASSYCARAMRCCNAEERPTYAYDGCIDHETENVRELLHEHVKSGHAVFHPEATSACLEAISWAECYSGLEMVERLELPACRDVFVGDLPDGATADTPEGCANGWYPDRSGAVVCATLPGDGQSCADFSDSCADGASCDFDNLMCHALRHEGEACKYPKDCLAPMDCIGSDPATNTPGTCGGVYRIVCGG